MIQCSLQALSQAPASMRYTFYDEDGLQILHNRDADVMDNFDAVLRELPIIPYTLSLIDADGNERFILKKKTLVTQSFPAFSLLFAGVEVDFLEDKERFTLPNISFHYNEERYQLTGSVRERTFYIEQAGVTLASYEGKLVHGGKEYFISIQSDRLPLAVYFGAAIVLDIYFHNY